MPSIQSKCRQNGTSDQYYVTLLQDPYGNFFRVVPRKENLCNCQLEGPDTPGEYVSATPVHGEIDSRSNASHRQMAWEAAQKEIIQTFRHLDDAFGQNLCNLRQMMSLLSIQLLMNDLIVALFESRRRHVNITSIVGSSTSSVGAILLITGLVFAPLSAGTSLGLSVAGGVVAGAGSVGVIGAKITEGVLTKHQLQALIIIQELLDVLSKDADRSNKNFLELAQRIADYSDYDTSGLGKNNAKIDSLASITVGRLLGSFHIVPVIVARATARVTSYIVGGFVWGLSFVVDTAVIAYAVYNLNKGNKTSTSEVIRQNATLLRATKVKLESYMHGHVK
ncbi:apolipoprotein L3-like [Argopecten irradians]|uniref:apolipoprotein L3-like n=1 Tax=Argopecten irradians TaxID=31199 RepID=UPI003724C2EA